MKGLKGLKKLALNPGEQNVKNFLQAANAYAEQQRQIGEPVEFLSAKNAKDAYTKCVKLAVALADKSHVKHNEVFNTLAQEFGGRRAEQIDYVHSLGEEFQRVSRGLAEAYTKIGMSPEKAVEGAFNSIAGNPVYDHFANLNLLAGQLFQEMTFMETWLSSGDAFAVPVEPGGTGLDKTRFRAPTEEITGSAKVMQGDTNPAGSLRGDASRTQINLRNEFKNAVTLYDEFSISQAMRDQALGYETAVNPALAGFILQNRYFQGSQQLVMKLAELGFVGGQRADGDFTPGVGGSYGLLSQDIMLALADWDGNLPTAASGADWRDNPTKLIQKIKNKLYLLTSTAAKQLEIPTDSATMYEDIVRLLQLFAQQNVNYGQKEVGLLVPSTWYALAMQYPGSGGGGTFNKQLNEMVETATNGLINKVVIKPSSLMNYGADLGNGQTQPYNYMAAVMLGASPEKKPVILPGQTAVPVVSSENVSSSLMNFRTQLLFGGPMFMQYGGAVLLEFSGHT